MSNSLKRYTKAESLYFLQKNKKKLNIKIPKFIFFTKKNYLKDYDNIFKKISIKFKKKKNNYKILLTI